VAIERRKVCVVSVDGSLTFMLLQSAADLGLYVVSTDEYNGRAVGFTIIR
jgi:hypothetical protein